MTITTAGRLNDVAKSYMRDAEAMKCDPDNFTSYDVVAYRTIATELRKIAAQLEGDQT